MLTAQEREDEAFAENISRRTLSVSPTKDSSQTNSSPLGNPKTSTSVEAKRKSLPLGSSKHDLNKNSSPVKIKSTHPSPSNFFTPSSFYSSPSTSLQCESQSNLPSCKYAEKCYRKNPDHLARFSHPNSNHEESNSPRLDSCESTSSRPVKNFRNSQAVNSKRPSSTNHGVYIIM